MAKKKDTRNPKKSKSGLKSTPLIICGLGLAFFIKGSFILLLVGMLPSIVSFYADTTKRRDVFRVVLTCNMTGVLPYLTELVIKSNSTSLLIQYLTDPKAWFMMYFSAGIGYALVKLMPIVISYSIGLANTAKIARLQSMQNRLIEEWGPEIQRTK